MQNFVCFLGICFVLFRLIRFMEAPRTFMLVFLFFSHVYCSPKEVDAWERFYYPNNFSAKNFCIQVLM